ncbi:MAG: 1-acyl-sn-glycerol-3-phosphate acyltransferase [Pseudomonadota bacterium]
MRSLIFNVAFFSGTFVYALVIIIAASFSGQATLQGLLHRHARFLMLIVRTILGARIEIRGRERFGPGEKPLLVVSKHQSELDAFMQFYAYPETAAVAMQQLANYPLIGPAIRKLGFIIVDVEGGKTNQLNSVVEGSRQVMAEGRPVLIYPEGELMRLGSRQRYRTGVYHIYKGTGQPATPVALCPGLVWPQRRWTKHYGQTAVYEYLEPIPPGLDQDTFMAELERRIEEGTMRLIREHGDPEVVAQAEERHAKGLTNDDDVTVESLIQARRPDAAA